MTGPLIYGFSEDAVAAAKVVADFAKTNDKLVIRGGALSVGKALDVNGVKQLANIPSGSAAGPAVGLADVAHLPHRRGAGCPGDEKRRRRTCCSLSAADDVPT